MGASVSRHSPGLVEADIWTLVHVLKATEEKATKAPFDAQFTDESAAENDTFAQSPLRESNPGVKDSVGIDTPTGDTPMSSQTDLPPFPSDVLGTDILTVISSGLTQTPDQHTNEETAAPPASRDAPPELIALQAYQSGLVDREIHPATSSDVSQSWNMYTTEARISTHPQQLTHPAEPTTTPSIPTHKSPYCSKKDLMLLWSATTHSIGLYLSQFWPRLSFVCATFIMTTLLSFHAKPPYKSHDHKVS